MPFSYHVSNSTFNWVIPVLLLHFSEIFWFNSCSYMGSWMRTLSAVKSLKCNYPQKEDVKIGKFLIWILKKYKYTKLYCLPTCYFFSLSGALLKRHTSGKIEYFWMAQITPGRGSQRINQNIELFPGKWDVVCLRGSRAVPSLPRKRDHFVMTGLLGALSAPASLEKQIPWMLYIQS